MKPLFDEERGGEGGGGLRVKLAFVKRRGAWRSEVGRLQRAVIVRGSCLGEAEGWNEPSKQGNSDVGVEISMGGAAP